MPGSELRSRLRPLHGRSSDWDGLLELAAGARLVLLGEASHGTHEFYAARADISRRLIEEHGFAGVVVEGDWPDAYRVNVFVRGGGQDESADQALSGFLRFPVWMWRNRDVLEFVSWLQERNRARTEIERAGFYGMDLYSLFGSIEAVLKYLRRVDPQASERARRRYACFDHFSTDAQAYGYAAGLGIAPSCERASVDQLMELLRRAPQYARMDGLLAADEYFQARQNALLVKSAERYYRSMFSSSQRGASWNLRDQHMAETVRALEEHLRATGRSGKLVVWAHNSHLGDARATEASESGELNLGQLLRESHGREALLVGFTTYSGSVTAASDWDGPTERKTVRPALPGSWEELLHHTGEPAFYLPLRGATAPELKLERLERFIGVVYRPDTERQSHYYHARLADQYDALVHYDATEAVEPLELAAPRHPEEVPETYPTGV